MKFTVVYSVMSDSLCIVFSVSLLGLEPSLSDTIARTSPLSQHLVFSILPGVMVEHVCYSASLWASQRQRLFLNHLYIPYGALGSQ